MDYSRIPAELRASSRWLVWRLQDQEQRKALKVPYSCRSGQPASVMNPNDWASFAEVTAAAVAKKFDGIGLVVGPPFLAIDIDKCIDENGVVSEEAKSWLQYLNSYTELSPSKKGFHVWLKGPAPKDQMGARTPTIEVYAGKRYLTMTGMQVEGTPDEVREITEAEVREIFSRVKAKPEKTKPATTSNHAKYELLKEGKFEEAGFTDVSAAVQSFLTYSAYHNLLDRDKMDADFRASKLYFDFRTVGRQSNWIDKWVRLAQPEISKAIETAKEWIERDRTKTSGRKGKNEVAWIPTAKFVKMADIVADELVWLWPNRVPLGCVTIFAGDPGIGKSLITLDLAGRGSTGQIFLDGQPNPIRFKTIMMSQEDDKATVIVPRLMAIGADLGMIEALDMVHLEDAAGEQASCERMVNLESDLQLIKQKLEGDPDIKLVIIDPLSNYMGSKSMFRDQEMREVLMPMTKLAQDTGVALIVIMHNSKQQGRNAMNKVGAALGGVGVARIGWSFVKSPDNPEELREMLMMKENLGKFKGITYKTTERMVEIKGKQLGQAVIEFVKNSTLDADSVMATADDPESGRAGGAARLIRQFIQPGGECLATLVYEAAEAKGISERTLKRSRQDLNISTKKTKDGWVWVWPAGGEGNAQKPPERDFGF